MSAGLWDYENKKAPVYGTEKSYQLAAKYLDGHCSVVEDWGCGAAGAKSYFKKSKYLGIDGSPGYADVVADLRMRVSDADGILLRYVLEHNYDWPWILNNAISSFKKRLVIGCFLEPREWTEMFVVVPGDKPGPWIPNLHLSRRVLFGMLAGFKVTEEVIDRSDASPHKHEWLFYVER